MHNSGSFGGYGQYNHWDGAGNIRRRWGDNDHLLLGGGQNYMGSPFMGEMSSLHHNKKVKKQFHVDKLKYNWLELEITGSVCNISNELWNLVHLKKLNLQNNSLTCISGEISQLRCLTILDLSANKLRDVPPELGDIFTLKELLLNNNCISRLPCELGRLFQLQTLGLTGNPLPSHLLSLCNEVNGTHKLVAYLQEKLPAPTMQLPERPWLTISSPDKRMPTIQFSVMCYNVLCDKYCTRQLYGYCPSWALSWEYRKNLILQEMKSYGADIISLQEVETEQFHSFFLPQLEMLGYSGVFSAKSRARTMTESQRKHVDGCAVFYRTSKFRLLKDHLIEFNQVAIEAADGQHDMINRVMTKDNIGLAVLLETTENLFSNGMPMDDGAMSKQKLLIATCHVHWDPEFCDVKLIQTMMFMHKIQSIIKDVQKNGAGSTSGISETANNSIDPNSIPLILCGDLNSLPDSGVVEYLMSGHVTVNHKDFKNISYHDCLHKLSHVPSESKGSYSHGFNLSQAYAPDVMSFTNYTYDFKGIIDYIFYSRDRIRVLGVLGGLDEQWFEDYRVAGCPHPKIPSDHLPLVGQFEITSATRHSGLPHFDGLPSHGLGLQGMNNHMGSALNRR